MKRRYIEAAPLSPEKRAELLENHYSWNMPDPYSDHQRARQAIHADQRKLILICRNPFTLNLVCAMVAEGGIYALPKNRAGLFAGFAELLLAREARLAKQRGQPWAVDTAKRVKTALERIAEALQRTDNGEQRTIIPKAEALAAINQPDGESLLQKAESANLIQVGESVRFTHQLLQEYFATAELRTAIERSELPHRFFSREWWDAGPYRETFVILGEVQRDPNAVARWLTHYSPNVALDVILRNGEGLTLADVTPETRAALIVMANVKKSEPDPRGRAAAYRVMGQLNADNRPGIGLRADGLPDIVWCEVPDDGEWVYQKDKHAPLPTFYMAKYEVTYAQFQAFIDAPDGFSNPQWWDGLHEAGLAQQKEGAGKQKWPIANHPRENVSWYDAMAFCRWLSAKLGYTITLPTEEQWEKAARSTDGREYPWGNGYQVGYANIDETSGKVGPYYLQQTTAVGIYPQGASPYGVLDLSGNVWEWTFTEYSNLNSNNLSNKESRVLRGGSFDDPASFARAAYRSSLSPGNRFNVDGFRVVCSVPVP